MAKRFCSQCGEPLQVNAAFCSTCGVPVSAVEPNQLRQESLTIQQISTSPLHVFKQDLRGPAGYIIALLLGITVTALGFGLFFKFLRTLVET